MTRAFSLGAAWMLMGRVATAVAAETAVGRRSSAKDAARNVVRFGMDLAPLPLKAIHREAI